MGLNQKGVAYMLYWALVFFIAAIIAGLFGLELIASAAVGIAQVLFFVFLLLFVVSLVGHFYRGIARERKVQSR
jgi:uncharacterized membrane protein YtjA (UPF0391 family)